MLLVDELLEWSPERARVRACVRAGNPFVEAGRAPALLLIEIMAQAVAAAGGMQQHLRGEAPRRGFLLGTRELELDVDELALGDELELEVERVHDDGKLIRYACLARRGADTLARAELNVMIAAEP
jgi:predicted hotdog family 3-hydroxylacyl-ACP dehydratase